ncbi:MAG: GNAT family N-acetyltransferase [Primorskyibacter sp.]
MIGFRRAGVLDTRPMAALLNEIIAIGGTTAFTASVTADQIRGWMAQAPARSVWHLAEDAKGDILGFQSIEPHPTLPPEVCDIASFVRVGQTGLGIGSGLFERSRTVAAQMGYVWINATIRADNFGGLAYYQSRGFEDYARHSNVRLGNGQIVDKISKRYDL